MICDSYFAKAPTVYPKTFVAKKLRDKLILMNKNEIKGNWNEQKGRLIQKFAILTDNDLLFEEGKKDEMLGKLQVKLGLTQEGLKKIIESV